jgi:predicted ATPase
LLLLDNVEHVRQAVAELVESRLAGLSALRLLVTSREPLGLLSEELLEIAPLAEPDAMALFLAGARAVRPLDDSPATLALVRRIVRAVDRLPLAIVLAARRLAVLGLAELAERLSHQLRVLRSAGAAATARHGTLEAAVRWSWDLLGPREQRALALCSVFRGGFSTAAIEELLEPEDGDALDLLQSLRGRSLLQPLPTGGPARFRLYEGVREFAAERLLELGIHDAAVRRHAAITLLSTERLAPEHRAPGAEALDALALESENLLAIHERHRAREPDVAARAVLALHPLLLLRGPFATHLGLLDDVLAARRPALAPELKGRLRLARGEVLRVRGRLPEARRELTAALRLARRARDRASEIAALRLKGAVARMQGRTREALSLHQRALERARAVGGEDSRAACLGDRATTLAFAGRLREACRDHRIALALYRAGGDRSGEGVQLSHLAVTTHRLGRVEEARALHERALGIHRELGHRRYEAAELCHLGFVHQQLGRLEAGRELHEQALAICREVGDSRLQAIVQSYLGDLETEAGEVTRARMLLGDALGCHERAGDRWQEAAAWLHLGYNHECSGQLEEARFALTKALARALPAQHWTRAAALANLAVLQRRCGDEARAAITGARALRCLGRLENPHQVLAIRLLLAKGPPRAPDATLVEASRSSSDVRRARRQAESGASRELWIGPEAAWFSFGHVRVDLSRRGALRRILAALATAHESGGEQGAVWHELWKTGWPGEHIRAESGLKRVYTAVWTLRKLGLEGVLLCREGGYLLDPGVPVRQMGLDSRKV